MTGAHAFGEADELITIRLHQGSDRTWLNQVLGVVWCGVTGAGRGESSSRERPDNQNVGCSVLVVAKAHGVNQFEAVGSLCKHPQCAA